jgi:hypothetical protein
MVFTSGTDLKTGRPGAILTRLASRPKAVDRIVSLTIDPMRLLAAIPHYFAANHVDSDGRRHGSLADHPRLRAAALASCISALHQLYGPAQRVIEIATRNAPLANASTAGLVDVVVCTTRGRHALAELDLPDRSYTHVETNAKPIALGFECHAALRDRLGGYDFYAYLEDDLTLRDSWLMQKLVWFTGQVGDQALLQPNRYEIGPLGLVHKAYIDGDLAPEITAPFQDVTDAALITSTLFDTRISFQRTLNPHSGCFFLNDRQMRIWTEAPHFLDRDTRFIGPLESAATLGLMRTFRMYKPSPENAAFLEIEHAGTAFLGQLRRRDDTGPTSERRE